MASLRLALLRTLRRKSAELIEAAADAPFFQPKPKCFLIRVNWVSYCFILFHIVSYCFFGKDLGFLETPWQPKPLRDQASKSGRIWSHYKKTFWIAQLWRANKNNLFVGYILWLFILVIVIDFYYELTRETINISWTKKVEPKDRSSGNHAAWEPPQKNAGVVPWRSVDRILCG